VEKRRAAEPAEDYYVSILYYINIQWRFFNISNGFKALRKLIGQNQVITYEYLVTLSFLTIKKTNVRQWAIAE